MNVFISWSGEKSKLIAESLHELLPMTIQQSVPFFSSQTIRGGSKWFDEIGTKLERTNFGIVCLTQANLDAPWLHFEAGALSKNQSSARVCSYLIDVEHSNVKPPLSQFHNHSADKEGSRKLLSSINSAITDSRLDEQQLDKLFKNVFWPSMEKVLEKAKTVDSATRTPRSLESKVDELLELARADASQRKRSMIRERMGLWNQAFSESASGSDGSGDATADTAESKVQSVLKLLSDLDAESLKILLKEYEVLQAQEKK